MAEKYDVAVVGATGAVGEVMISILEQRKFPVGKLYPLASERSRKRDRAFLQGPYPAQPEPRAICPDGKEV